jgi:hypothetical protein
VNGFPWLFQLLDTPFTIPASFCFNHEVTFPPPSPWLVCFLALPLSSPFQLVKVLITFQSARRHALPLKAALAKTQSHHHLQYYHPTVNILNPTCIHSPIHHDASFSNSVNLWQPYSSRPNPLHPESGYESHIHMPITRPSSRWPKQGGRKLVKWPRPTPNGGRQDGSTPDPTNQLWTCTLAPNTATMLPWSGLSL